MLFDLDELLTAVEESRIAAKVTPWGYMHEVDLGERANTLIKVIRVNEGHRTSLQYHQEKDEVIIILEGEGWIEFPAGPKWRSQHPPTSIFKKRYHPEGGPVRIGPGVRHRAIGPLLMLEISTRHPDDVVRVEDDYGR